MLDEINEAYSNTFGSYKEKIDAAFKMYLREGVPAMSQLEFWAGLAFSCQKELKYVANSRARNLLRIVAVDSTLVNMIEGAAAVPINTINCS